MKILITGTSGMIGGNMVRWLQRNLNEAMSIKSLGRRPVDLPGSYVRHFDLSLADHGRIPGLGKVDLVFHFLAAGTAPHDRDLDELISVNVNLPPKLVEIAVNHKAKAFVMAGTSAEYGANAVGVPINEDAVLETSKAYGSTKAAGVLLALMQGHRLGLPVSVARLFNVYGPGERAHRLVPTILRNLSNGLPVALSPGKQIRDFIYVDDVCEAVWTMASLLESKQLQSGIYNVCTGVGLSVEAFARSVAQEGNLDEGLLQFGALPLRPDDLDYLVGDPTRLKRATDWSAKFNVQEGIQHLLRQEMA